MKAILTGGAGFIGYHLTQRLLSDGYKVICIDNLSTGSLSNVETHLENKNYQFIQAPAQDLSLYTDSLLKDATVLFNLAASVGVQNIFDNPIECIENNIDIAKTVLNVAKKNNLRTFMFSTSEVYGKTQKFPFSEEDDCTFGSYKSLRWGYAASKLIDDYLSRSYFENFNTPVTTIRLFNTIGVKQVGSYGMVVPRFFDKALNNKPIEVYGSGHQSRCFTDVRDVIESIMLLINNKKSYGELVNIGSSTEITILDLAVKIKKLTNSSSEIISKSYEDAYGQGFEDIQRRVPNAEKLFSLTNFRPNPVIVENNVLTNRDSNSWMFDNKSSTSNNSQARICTFNYSSSSSSSSSSTITLLLSSFSVFTFANNFKVLICIVEYDGACPSSDFPLGGPTRRLL